MMHSLANWKTSDFVVFAGNHLEQQISSCLMEDEMGNHFFFVIVCLYRFELSLPHTCNATDRAFYLQALAHQNFFTFDW